MLEILPPLLIFELVRGALEQIGLHAMRLTAATVLIAGGILLWHVLSYGSLVATYAKIAVAIMISLGIFIASGILAIEDLGIIHDGINAVSGFLGGVV